MQPLDDMTRDPFVKHVSTYTDHEHVNVVIETPSGRRTKYAWDPKQRAFRMTRVLPLGTTFPYDFGFIPGTESGDGDPLDVLVLADEPLFPGCVAECRVLGAIECKTGEAKDKLVRNDRLIAVPRDSVRGAEWHNLNHIGDTLIREIGEFFADYTRREGRTFELVGTVDRARALALIKAAQ